MLPLRASRATATPTRAHSAKRPPTVCMRQHTPVIRGPGLASAALCLSCLRFSLSCCRQSTGAAVRPDRLRVVVLAPLVL
jgi:hypothetical protein